MSSRTRWTQIGAALTVAGAALFLGPCAHAGDTVDVTIADYKYAPAELRVKPGTTVKWINGEKRTSHSILFLGPDGFESERIFPGESWSRTFERPGSYPYRCGPHPEMKGVVEVAE
jgi:plastocyanin